MKKSICMLALIVGSLASASSAFAASDWEWQVPPATGNDLLSVTYTGTDFYAVGRAGVIVTSNTGGLGTWTHIPSPSIPTPIQKTYDFTGVAGTGKTIVAISATPPNVMPPVVDKSCLSRRIDHRRGLSTGTFADRISIVGEQHDARKNSVDWNFRGY